MTPLPRRPGIGLDRTGVCVVDGEGRRIAEAMLPTEPEALIAWLRDRAPSCERVGLEACPLSDWLHGGLPRPASRWSASRPTTCMPSSAP